MPRKKKNISRSRKSGRKVKAAAQSSPGSTTSTASITAPAAVLDQQKLQQLYTAMLKCRALSRRVQEISSKPEGFAAREAVFAGTLAHSRRDDCVVAAQDAPLIALLRGAQLTSVVAQPISDPISDPIDPSDTAKVSPGQLALIRGMGQARDLLQSGKVALVFCGNDPGALAFQREAVALAAKHKAPVVCLIETNLSLLTAGEHRTGKKRKRTQGHFPEIVVDGADVVAVFRVAQEAVRRARNGQGPSLITCVMPDEGTPDPLAFMEQYLRRKNLWSDEWQRRIADDFTVELDAALTSHQQTSRE
jgi:TPP-dependent pyruvate/acetoin dehydrogenase alpha subunit